MKKLLPERKMLRWESVEPSHRSRRLLKLGMVSMHVDLDGSLVDKTEEYGSSSSASSHSSEDVGSNDVQDPMDDFE